MVVHLIRLITGFFFTDQIVCRLDVRTPTAMSPAASSSRPTASAPLTALQLLHAGQLNAAFEKVYVHVAAVTNSGLCVYWGRIVFPRMPFVPLPPASKSSVGTSRCN